MPTTWKMEGIFINYKMISFVVMVTVVVTLSRYLNKPGMLKMEPREQDVLPHYCTAGILDGIQYTASEQKRQDFLSVVQRQSCRLRHYKLEHTVSCLDELSASTNDGSSLARMRKEWRNKFHIAFVGDSRMRILYLSFIKLIPDYDRKSNIDPTARHKDADMMSSLFGDLIVSFRWRPLIAGKVIDDLQRWIDILQQSNANYSQGRNGNLSSDYPPDVLVLGMASWDMLQQEGNDHLWYQKGLEDLVPLFHQLLFPNPSGDYVKTRRIIWLNQYTTFDFYAGNDGANRVIFKEKLQLCNRIARRILRGSGVAVWDSSDAIAEEAVRACKLHHRSERVKDFMSVAYINCKDYIHAGYVALQQMTQLLYNDLYYEVLSSPVSGWCELCEKLNDPQQKPKIYKDLTDWWFHKDIPCLYGYDYFENLQQDSK